MLQLRWQLFRNSLRLRSRNAELAIQWIGYAFGALFVLGASFGIFSATFLLLREGRQQILTLLLWAIFLLWQLVPVLVEGYSPGLNFSEIARYPVSFPLYFLLNAAYGLFDPAAIAGLLWLLSMWLGIASARPEWMLPSAALLVVFAGFNVLCNRFVLSLFERVQSTRKGRERMAAILLLLMLAPQFFQFVVSGWIDVRRYHPPSWAGNALARLYHLLPPGQVSRTLTLPGAQKLLPASLLLVYLLLAAWLLAWRLRAVYHGEIYAESFAARRDLKIKPGWRLPGLDEKITAIVGKELRYLQQNARLLVQLVYPLIAFAFLALGPGRRVISFGSGAGILGAFAGLMGLSVSNLSYNAFGMDREGFARWLLSPLSLKRVLVAKNLVQGMVLSAFYLAGAIMIARVEHVSWSMFTAVTAGFLCVLIVQIAAGNIISVHWPKRIELTKMSSRTASGAAGPMSLAFTLPLVATVAFVIFATWFWKLAWLPLAAGTAGLALSLVLYSWLANLAVRYAGDHLEEIAGQLGS